MATIEQRSVRMTEERCVERWRYLQLLAAGYAPRAAAALAARHDVDLHLAVGLLEHGCPAATALDILL